MPNNSKIIYKTAIFVNHSNEVEIVSCEESPSLDSVVQTRLQMFREANYVFAIREDGKMVVLKYRDYLLCADDTRFRNGCNG